MGDHQQFGRSPTLRPRSPGVSHASRRSVGPEQLASDANATASAFLLGERLQSPRPGSAAAVRGSATILSPRHGAVAVVVPADVVPPVGGTGVRHHAHVESYAIRPTALLSKPPMRPKSAAHGANRGVVSQHRMDAIKPHVVTTNTNQTTSEMPLRNQPTGTNNQHEHQHQHQHQQVKHLVAQLQRVALPTVPVAEDSIRAAAQSTVAASSSGTLQAHPPPPRLPPKKRPFSAAPATATAMAMAMAVVPESGAAAVARSSGSSQRRDAEPPHPSASASAPRPAKRPFSASPDLRRKEPRTLSTNAIDATKSTQPPGKEQESMPQTRTQTLATQTTSNAIEIMTSFHRDTFVYAVPRHCLERGRQYNPYDIVTVSHEALCGANLTSRMIREPRFDYYTVSATAMTFHCKDDNFEPTYLPSSEWERQKANFTKICKLPTFQLFRYRKTFLGWKKWIRTEKVEHARTVLLSSLYFSQPVLNKGMKEIQVELFKLQELDLVCDLEGKTHHLSQLAAKSSDHVHNQGITILTISGRIQQLLLRVCQECLSSTESPYGGFPGHEFALSTRKSSNYHIFEAFVARERALVTANDQFIQHDHFLGVNTTTKLSPSKAAQLRLSHRKQMERVARAQIQRPRGHDPLDDIRWTMAAIQRRRCLLLTKFVMLIDFMALDAFHSLLIRSIQRLRDTLWVGANAVPIATLVDRHDYVLAFHRTLERRQQQQAGAASMGTHGETGQRTSHGGSSSTFGPLVLNRQQTKRFFRAALEPKLATLLRVDTTPADAERESEHKSSSAVWLESRLDAFFLQGLTQQAGADKELFTLDDLMAVVDQFITQTLVLPDFDAVRCGIEAAETEQTVDTGSAGRSLSVDVQQIETLAPVALVHMSMSLQVDDISKRASIVVKPTLDRIVQLIQEILTSFVELFRMIPSIVIHHELRAILEFGQDFRSSSIGQHANGKEGGDASDPTHAGHPAARQTGDEDEDDSSPRWNKSNYDRLFTRVANDTSFTMLRGNIEDLTTSAMQGADAFTRHYDETLANYTRNEQTDLEDVTIRFRKDEYTLLEMERAAQGFQAQIDALHKLKETQMIEFLQFDMTKLKDALLPSPVRWLMKLHTLYPSLAKEKCELFLTFVRKACTKMEKPLGGSVRNGDAAESQDRLEAFAKYLLHLRDVQDETEEKEFNLTFLHDLFKLLDRLGIGIKEEVGQVFELCEPEFEALKSHLNEALAKRDADIHEYTPLLLDHVKRLTADIEDLKTKSADQTMTSGESVSNDARELANTLERQAGTLQDESTQLVWVQRVFREFAHGARPPMEEFIDLQVVSNELKLKNELWEAVNDAEQYLEAKQDETLRALDLGTLRNIQSKVDAVMKRLQQNALQIAAIKRLESCKSILEGLSPVIRDLRNDTLEERHWTKLEHKMKCSFVRQVVVQRDEQASDRERDGGDEGADGDDHVAFPEVTKEVKFLDLPLRHLLEVDAVAHAALIRQVSEEATAEAAIAKNFHAVVQTWETRAIPSYAKKDRDGRDALWLGDCSEIFTLLEESEVLLRVMESSSYARVIHHKLSKLLHDLATTKETIELLTVCFQKWEYLQRLVSVDFVRSFPEQSKSLQTHDTNWKSIMDTIAKKPLCLPFGIHSEHRQALQVILQGFEKAACCLEQHLEIKRQCFPAFCKLSNVELATLLSKVRDVQNIQKFLYQCFDNVARINFGTREACQDVLSISSRAFPQAEVISMGKNLKARGPPEQWLVAIEKRLVEMLRKGTKEAVMLLSQAYAASAATTNTSGTAAAAAFDTAALHVLPLQCVILADRILRCEMIDRLLAEHEDPRTGSSPPMAVALIHAKLHQLQVTLIERIFGDCDATATSLLTPRELVLLTSLRLQEMEFRDCVDDHFLSCTALSGSADAGLGVQWSLQLKHRFDDTTTVGYDCHVEMDGLRVPYGFNYINAMSSNELVFTPHSMRMVFAIFAATRHAQSVLLTGPQGSSKQTMALQMSRLFGRRYFGAQMATADSSSSMPNASNLCHVAQYTKLLRGALQAGGIFCVSLQQNQDTVAMLRVLGALVSRIEHSVLCKLPISGLQKDPIQWIPGTTLLISCRILPSSSPRWAHMQHEMEIAAATFARISVVANHNPVLILETLMYSKGFDAPRRNAQRLALLWQQLRSLDGMDGVATKEFFSLRMAKQVIVTVAQDVWKNTEPFERESLQSFLLCEAVMDVCTPLLLIPDHCSEGNLKAMLLDALDDIFQYKHHAQEWYTKQWRRKKQPTVTLEAKKWEELLVDAAHELHFVPRRALSAKSMEVARSLATNIGVIMVGPSGVGKTTTCTVLAKAMDRWKSELAAESHAQKTPSTASTQSSQIDTPTPLGKLTSGDAAKTTATESGPPTAESFVSVRVVLPMALTLTQLIGSTASDTKGQIKSVLGRLIRDAQESYALNTDLEIQHALQSSAAAATVAPLLSMQRLLWVVFDGGASCGGVWLDVLMSVLSRKLPFSLIDCCDDPSRELVGFADGEFMTIPPNLRFIFEAWSLANATPTLLQQTAIVVFPPPEREEQDDDVDEKSLPIHYACIQRFLEQQRLAAMAAANEANSPASAKLSAAVYDTVANHLLDTDILAKIFMVMEDYRVAIKLSLLQRVEYLLSMLQALLNSVATTCSASRKAQDGSPKEAASSVNAIPVEDVRQRVEMAIVYALLWGFSACSNAHSGDSDSESDSRSRALQLLISGMLKTHFEEIAHTWEDCGRESNLFELLLDLNGLRFVSFDSGDTTILRDKLWCHAIASSSSTNTVAVDQRFHSLFIPTTSSLIVHAAMKEAARSARGVVLVGTDTSRKTILLQNFLKQLESLRVLTSSNYASIPPPVAATATSDDAGHGVSTTRRKRAIPRLQAPLFPAANDSNAFASLDRIRLHQVGLVKRLAKRFRTVNKAAAAAAALAAAQHHTRQPHVGREDGQLKSKSKTTKKELEWSLPAHLHSTKANMVSKFDTGDVIPFFFAMNQQDRGVQELASCLERMLQRERRGIYEPPPGKIAVLIIDDLHLPVATHDEEHPSCHEYLRSAYESWNVMSLNTGSDNFTTAITIENLMMVASISSRAMPSDEKATHEPPLGTRHFSLDKLTRQFVPVYAPPCSHHGLYTIFHTVLVAHWESMVTSPLEKLSAVVRQQVPIVVAATIVLWEKLRRRGQGAPFARPNNKTASGVVFNLHGLTRVYAGMCGVEPSYLLDTETMARLVTHEMLRSFDGVVTAAADAPQWKAMLKRDLFRVRVLLDGLENQPQRSQGGASTAPTNPDLTRASNLNTSTNASGYLSFFMAELLCADTKKSGGFAISAQQRAANERKNLHKIGRWAFVPASLYYQASSDTGTLSMTGASPLNAPFLGTDSNDMRRSSLKFMRRQSLEKASTGYSSLQINSKSASMHNTRWIYVELPLLDGDENLVDEANSHAIQQLFAGVVTFGASTTRTTTTMANAKPMTDLVLQMQIAQLPKAAPQVTPLMAHNLATLERVFTPQGARVVLLGPPGSAREVLLRYACAIRQSSQPHSIWTVEGVDDAAVIAAKWDHVVHQLVDRVGVDCESVTLLIKRLTKWPQHVMSQLLALVVSGEIPGAFTLEEQIKLATRVRDERLIELDQRYQAHQVRIRSEVELQKGQELHLLTTKTTNREKSESGDPIATSSASAITKTTAIYQELERKYQHALLLKLSQAQLRYQQEMDDFMRKCEVENESVTATIMSVMRPLGMTSGKWQQIVQRMRKRLKIVVLVDVDESYELKLRVPQLFHVCNVAPLSPMDPSSLQTVLYGSLHAETMRSFRQERAGVGGGGGHSSSTSITEERAEFAQFIDRVDHELPKMAALAAEMHTSAITLAGRENRVIPTEVGVVVASFFTKLLRAHYQQARDDRRKIEWFSYVHGSMEKSLWKLQDRDVELKATLASCDQQIEISSELLIEQTEDCDRIRDMMKRFQGAAEDQVEITNEMEQRAQAELHVPMACLEEANAALLMIDKRHIVEIKSFNSPPLMVHLVLDAVCVMFHLEPAWENARKILADANVVHTLLTYDKDNISQETLAKLESTYICDPRFHREEVEKQSVAASMMVVWVRAMYQYATARRQVLPTLEKLDQAQSRLRLLMQEYQVSKQRVIEADEALSKTRETLETAKERRQETVDDMESRRTRMEDGRVVLDLLKADKDVADGACRLLDKDRAYGLTWWNALLAAGALAYASYFDAADRVRLYEEWGKAYACVVAVKSLGSGSSKVDTETQEEDVGVSFVPVVSLHIKPRRPAAPVEGDGTTESVKAEEEEASWDPHDPMHLFRGHQRHWELASACGSLFSARSLQDMFLLTQTANAAFPVVVVTSYSCEMEEMLVKGARHIWKWTELFMVSTNASDFDVTLATAMEQGHQLLILDVEPLDIEFELGKLSGLFHGQQAAPQSVGDTDRESGTGSGTGHAKEGNYGAFVEGSGTSSSMKTKTEAAMQPPTIPVHRAFRAVLATYRDPSAFGDALLTSGVPVLSAKLHTSEVADFLIDKLWHPGVLESGSQAFGLKQSVREFERLCHQYEDTQSQLTKLIQSAAVRGQFQKNETDRIRDMCTKTNDLRVLLVSKRHDIQARIKTVQRHEAIARLGAAIYNGFNTGSSSTSIRRLEDSPPRVPLQVFLPMWMAAIKKKPETMGTGTPSSSVAHSPSFSGRGAGSSLFRTASRLAMLGSHHQAQGSTRAVTTPLAPSASFVVRGNGLESVSEILTKMLHQLMPLVRDVNEWYHCVVSTLWLLERQSHPVDAHLSSNAETVNEAVASTLDATTVNCCEPRVRQLLSLLKLSHRKSQATCHDYDSLPLESNGTDDRIVSLVVDGHIDGMVRDSHSELHSQIALDLSGIFAGSRCRADRVKTAMAMYPQLARSICDRILHGYGVQVRFVACEMEEFPSYQPSVTGGSILVRGSTGHTVFAEIAPSPQGPHDTIKTGWVRASDGFQDSACLLVRSESPFGSFGFLRRAFYASTGNQQSQLNILKFVSARSFHGSSDELDDVFLLPTNNRLLRRRDSSCSIGEPRVAGTLMGENALMVRDSPTLVQMEPDKLAVLLDAVPLAIINLMDLPHVDGNSRSECLEHWEELYHMIHPNPQRTTSTELRRFENHHHHQPASHSTATTSNCGSRAMMKPAATALSDSSSSTGATAPAIVSSTVRGHTQHAARRMSTQLQHRPSGVADLLADTTVAPLLIAVPPDNHCLPSHLHASMVALASDTTELGSDHAPSLKRCIQETLLRVAYHPCSRHSLFVNEPETTSTSSIKQPLGRRSSTQSVLTGAQETDTMQLLFHYMTALVVYHALLMYRWQLSLRQYSTASSVDLPAEKYTWDVLITALDQLLHVLVQHRAATKLSSQQQQQQHHQSVDQLQLHLRNGIRQQVFLSAYSRQVRTHHELSVLRTLCRECLCLVHDSISDVSATATTGAFAMGSQHRPSMAGVAAQTITAGMASSRSIRSQRLLNMAASASAGTAAGSSSRQVFTRRTSQGDHTQSLLTNLHLPLKDLRESVQDMNTWLELLWTYTERVDHTIENHGRDLFGLQPPVEVTPSSYVSTEETLWMERFGWTKQPVRYGSIASQFSLDDALRCLEALKDKIIPPLVDDTLGQQTASAIHDPREILPSGSGDGGDGGSEQASESVETILDPASSTSVDAPFFETPGMGVENEATELAVKMTKKDHVDPIQAHTDDRICLQTQVLSSSTTCYNRHIERVQEMVQELIDGVSFWMDNSKTKTKTSTNNTKDDDSQQQQRLPKTLACIPTGELRESVLSILCNQVPRRLLDQISLAPTYLLASIDVTLDTLATHYQRWHRNLVHHSSTTRVAPPRCLTWWLPGIPDCMGIAHLLELAKRSAVHNQAIPSDGFILEIPVDQFELSFSLFVDKDNNTWTENPEISSCHHHHHHQLSSREKEKLLDAPDRTAIAILSGLELRMATWDTERGYLQTLDRHTSRTPQRVSIICHLEKKKIALASATEPSSKKHPPTQHQHQRLTRSCPLLARGGVVFEFELPIGPAFGSMSVPFLSFSVL